MVHVCNAKQGNSSLISVRRGTRHALIAQAGLSLEVGMPRAKIAFMASTKILSGNQSARLASHVMRACSVMAVLPIAQGRAQSVPTGRSKRRGTNITLRAHFALRGNMGSPQLTRRLRSIAIRALMVSISPTQVSWRASHAPRARLAATVQGVTAAVLDSVHHAMWAFSRVAKVTCGTQHALHAQKARIKQKPARIHAARAIHVTVAFGVRVAAIRPRVLARTVWKASSKLGQVRFGMPRAAIAAQAHLRMYLLKTRAPLVA
jgi:hypothetical protein